MNRPELSSYEIRWLETILPDGLADFDVATVHVLTRAELATVHVDDNSLYRIGIYCENSLEWRDIMPGSNMRLGHILANIQRSSGLIRMVARRVSTPLDFGERLTIEVVRPPKQFGVEWERALEWLTDQERHSVFDPTSGRFQKKPLATVTSMLGRTRSNAAASS